MNALGGAAAVIDGGDGQVLAAGGAVAARPDIGEGGAALGVDLDAPAVEHDRVLHRGRATKVWPIALKIRSALSLKVSPVPSSRPSLSAVYSHSIPVDLAVLDSTFFG